MKYFHIGILCILFFLLRNILCTEEQSIISESLKIEHMQTALSILSNGSNEDSVTEILDFLDENNRKIQFSKRKEIVLILGNADTEKKSLALLLTDTELKLIPNGSCDYAYADKYDVINKLAQKNIPEIIADEKSGIEYYIYPGWDLTMDTKYEILTLYSGQRVLNFARMLKIIFVIDFHRFPDREANRAERNYLREFIANATIWMKNINSTWDGYSLVVTDVENRFQDDASEIGHVEAVLNEARQDFLRENELPDTTDEQKEFNKKKIGFIANLVVGTSLYLERIGILRIANKTGLAYDMPWLQRERKTISRNLRNFMRYIDREKVDFDFPISARTSKNILILIIELQKRLANDISIIGSDISEFFLQEEKQYSDLNILYEKMCQGHIYLSKANSTKPKEFAKELLNAVDILKVNLIIEHLKNCFNHIELYDYLIGKIKLPIPFQISSKLQKITKYLEASEKWYGFLIHLHKILSELKIQTNIKLYGAEVARLMVQFSIEEYEEKNIDDTQLEQFLNRIGSNIYERVKNMTVNSYKMNAIKSVLNQTMNSYTKYICSTNKLIVYGYYVILSDVLRIECFVQAKFIEILAINTIFIDTDIDKTGEKAQILIVATTWYVNGFRKIILNGKPGEPHAPNENGGMPGKPGKPGGSAGNFVAIGNDFIRDHVLEVYVNGGKGGPGQEGGEGGSGSEGEDPPIPKRSIDAPAIWNDENFKFQLTELRSNASGKDIPKEVYTEYIVWTKGYINPSDGGDGGVGGIGGNAGTFYVIGLKGSPHFRISNAEGESGTGGVGGEGGSGIAAKWTNVSYSDVYYYENINYGEPNVAGGSSEESKAANGANGTNTEGIEYPDPVELKNVSFTVNKFKYHIREKLPENILETDFRKLMENLENQKYIQALYDTSGFADELQSIEDQYYQMRNQLSFVPFIESILNRTIHYANNYTEPNLNRKALKFVYTTALSKLGAIQKHENSATIIDLLEQMETVEENIDRYWNSVEEVNIYESQEKYKRSLIQKIKLTNKFFRTHIKPELESIIIEVTEQIPILIQDVIDYRRPNNESRLIELYDRRTKLDNMFRLHIMLNIVDVIRSLLEFSGLISPALAEVIGGDTSVADALFACVDPLMIENIQEKNKIVGLFEAYDLLFPLLKETLRRKHKLFLEQLKDIESELPVINVSGNWVLPIRIEIVTIQFEINVYLRSNAIIDPTKVDGMRIRLKKVLDENEPSSNSDKKIWTHFQNIVAISDISFEVYSQIHDDIIKIEEVANSRRNIHGRQPEWEAGEKKIYSVIVSLFTDIQNGIKFINDNINNRCHMELDIPQNHVQNSLREIKMIWSNITEWTLLQRILHPSVIKYDENFALLIDVYDRMDSYMEKAKFIANYLNAVSSHETTKNHSIIVSNLKENIQTNLAMEQYEVMMNALRQYQFPFGYIPIDTLELPGDLQFNDSKQLIRKTKDYINYLKGRIMVSNLPLGRFDENMYRNIDFNVHNSTVNNDTYMNSFYVWKIDEIRSEVERFLHGEEVIIKADVTKGLTVNALRFNEIGIQFLLENNTLQIELDKILEKFVIRMTILGNTYLRCGSRFYYLSLDDEIVIEYSQKKDSNGKPIKTNEAYRKITERGYILSPYTTWKIQLITDISESSGVFPIHDELEKFKNISSMHLRLTGQGQHYRSQEILLLGICNKQLDNYYQFDSTISIQNLDKIKFQHLL